MTKIEAIRLLRHVWGDPVSMISMAESDALEKLAQPEETLLQTCARLAGIDVRNVAAFDHAAIRRLTAEAEIKHAREWWILTREWWILRLNTKTVILPSKKFFDV